ncbi:MAG: hypothetical protein KDI71_12935 [Xanthomonadales bacterium]|nr:hypothetical protein [Xanthomonadales bacterium]
MRIPDALRRTLLILCCVFCAKTADAQDDFSWLTDPAAVPPVFAILDPCRNPNHARQLLESFADGLEGVLSRGHEDTALPRQLGQDAVAKLRHADVAAVEQICAFLSARPDLPHLLAQAAAVDRSESECLSRGAFFARMGVVRALDTLTHVADGFCDAASCLSSFLTGPLCVGLCVPPPTLRLISAPIELDLTIDDQCGVSEHELWMSRTRVQVVDATTEISEQLGFSIGGIVDVAREIITEPAVDSFRSLIEGGFRSGATQLEGSSAGVNSQLADLRLSIDANAQQLAANEADALAQLIEQTLAGEAIIHLLLLPPSAGGMLVEVRELVATRLAALSDGGAPVDAALEHFRRGDQSYNAARYLDAYQAYRDAYKALQALPVAKIGRAS